MSFLDNPTSIDRIRFNTPKRFARYTILTVHRRYNKRLKRREIVRFVNTKTTLLLDAQVYHDDNINLSGWKRFISDDQKHSSDKLAISIIKYNDMIASEYASIADKINLLYNLLLFDKEAKDDFDILK